MSFWKMYTKRQKGIFVFLVFACVAGAIGVFFAVNPLYLYVNDTNIAIAGTVQQASSPSCELDLSAGEKKLDSRCGNPEVFYEAHGGVWFKPHWKEENFLFLKVVRFSNADEHFFEIASGKTDEERE